MEDKKAARIKAILEFSLDIFQKSINALFKRDYETADQLIETAKTIKTRETEILRIFKDAQNTVLRLVLEERKLKLFCRENKALDKIG